MNKYLVKIYWKYRQMARYAVDADNETQAIYNAVSLGAKSQGEMYDHAMSKAQFVFKHEVVK
ncbi:hypothetical protein NVP1082O_40 [Vibrio phage 1.082.O._10N.261.49.E4]|nr:hypothetical protein NVP1082O_40 [Vibrio phage 1.082.O._10N.261.49.E4]